MIEEIKMQLNFLNLPVYEIMKSISKKDYLNKLVYIKDICNMIEEGKDFHFAWLTALENTYLPYKSEEIERLLHIGLNLGISDTENQLVMLSLNSEYFEEYIKIAKLQDKKYGNMTVTLGALSGCTLFILLL